MTREAVLAQAVEIANRVGLAGLTIGSLAESVDMSKSGLFAHFRSKEALQLQVLRHARESFIAQVVRPALATARGEPRLRTLFEQWLACEREHASGCLFLSAASELADQPGTLREQLVSDHRDLTDAVAQMARSAISEGHFRADVDAEQFAHDLYAAMLGFFYAYRMLRQPEAEARTRRAFEALLAAARP
jgi:AcrR family transcriptional regulator